MRVGIVETRWLEVRKAAKERLASCVQKNLCVACLGEIEGNEQVLRGCHSRCYHATWRGIKAGKFTEEDRVRAGKLLECKPVGRPPSNPVSVEVA